MAPPLKDNLTVGTKVMIAQDADLRGEISIGSGTVIHPRATVLALQGSISIGSNCIIEESVVIVNRRKDLLKIGDGNLFSVGCRIECPRIGSNNIFESRCRVASSVVIGSFCTIGAACTVLPQSLWPGKLEELFDSDNEDEQQQQDVTAQTAEAATTTSPNEQIEVIPDRTVVFGNDNRRRLWSGEGVRQQAALRVKHLEYLRNALPQHNKLKIIQGVRAPQPSATATS